MKKRHSFGKRAIFALLATLLTGMTPGCSGGSQESGAVLQSIAITSPPTTTVYVIGEALDISGLVAIGTYSDGTTRTETVSLAAISGYDANTVGTQTLTVTINGKTATFTVTVTAPGSAVLQSIAITDWPAKTVYEPGEALNISGLVVTGTYSDGTTKRETVSLSNISGYDADTVGAQTLTVTINGKTATFTVTVTAPGGAALQSIAITSQPAKTVYVIGEALDLTGLIVTGTYSDGTAWMLYVSESSISGYHANATGTQTLTVTVNGKTATFTVTVNASAQTTAGFTVSLEDPLDGFPEAIVLSKGGAPASIILAITGAYASCQWLLNDSDTPVSTSASYTLNAADCRLGVNTLMVEARTASGAYYSREITFTVAEGA
ncbi:MAG: bacterial Ig-like domain-containing protein [Treponema sp.]|jgi:hypothetical protein|nr:bacterial Ig-like domain-containing protein [Treponema sp.]